MPTAITSYECGHCIRVTGGKRHAFQNEQMALKHALEHRSVLTNEHSIEMRKCRYCDDTIGAAAFPEHVITKHPEKVLDKMYQTTKLYTKR
jgi:hypothetical protein